MPDKQNRFVLMEREYLFQKLLYPLCNNLWRLEIFRGHSFTFRAIKKLDLGLGFSLPPSEKGLSEFFGKFYRSLRMIFHNLFSGIRRSSKITRIYEIDLFRFKALGDFFSLESPILRKSSRKMSLKNSGIIFFGSSVASENNSHKRFYKMVIIF